MSTMNNIRAALEQALATVSGMPAASNWAVDNGPKYTPQDGTPWARVQVFQTSRRPSTRGASPTYRREGVMMVSLMWPKALGAGAAETLADAICSEYGVDDSKTSGGTAVRFEYSEAGDVDGESDPSWFALPVTIAWYAYEAS